MKKIFTAIFGFVLVASLGYSHTGNHDGGMSNDHTHNHEGLEMDHNMVIPHMHLGGGYETRISLMNPGGEDDVTGTFYFYAQDGTKLDVEIDGDFLNTFEVTIPAGGIEYITLGNPEAPSTIGYALFVSDSTDDHGGSMMKAESGFSTEDMMDDDHEMMGDHLFAGVIYSRYGSNENLTTQVGTQGMRFMSGMHRGFAVHLINNERNISGIAMVNTSDEEISVNMLLKNALGEIVSEMTIVLSAGQQIVDIVSNFFPGNSNLVDFDGILEIKADSDGIVPLALVSTDGILTAIPVVMIPNEMVHMGGGSGGMM